MAETINGLYKAEVIHRRAPWRSFEAVEFATLEWVDWFNTRRLLALIGNIPPPRPKPPTTHGLRPCQSPRRTQTNQPPANPGRLIPQTHLFESWSAQTKPLRRSDEDLIGFLVA